MLSYLPQVDVPANGLDFVCEETDFWAIDWDYGHRAAADDKPIFESEWQSFRLRKSKGEVESLTFTAEYRYAEAGQYRIAARVTDVFGNDGIATVSCEVT